MRLLVLGGTAWLGRLIARQAQRDGHAVTCAARGDSGSPADGVAFVRIDRDRDDLARAVGETAWDAVIDLARQPGQVRRASRVLARQARRYIFVSSCSVYADQQHVDGDESGATVPPLRDEVMVAPDLYPAAKVAGEGHVLDAFGSDRSTIVRPGLIAGPGDVSDRTGYWPWRFAGASATGRQVLVPDARGDACQVIDARDLAAWIVLVGVAGLSGVFDAVGPRHTLGEHLDAARGVAGHTGPVVAADPGWLLDHGVQPWSGHRSLPLWVGDPTMGGFLARSGRRARSAGLTCRPLADTLADTMAWERARPAGSPRAAGLSDADEQHLLAAHASDDGEGPA